MPTTVTTTQNQLPKKQEKRGDLAKSGAARPPSNSSSSSATGTIQNGAAAAAAVPYDPTAPPVQSPHRPNKKDFKESSDSSKLGVATTIGATGIVSKRISNPYEQVSNVAAVGGLPAAPRNTAVSGSVASESPEQQGEFDLNQLKNKLVSILNQQPGSTGNVYDPYSRGQRGFKNGKKY